MLWSSFSIFIFCSNNNAIEFEEVITQCHFDNSEAEKNLSSESDFTFFIFKAQFFLTAGYDTSFNPVKNTCFCETKD